MKSNKFTIATRYFLTVIAFLTLIVVTISGCDEANMIEKVISEPTEEPIQQPEPTEGAVSEPPEIQEPEITDIVMEEPATPENQLIEPWEIFIHGDGTATEPTSIMIPKSQGEFTGHVLIPKVNQDYDHEGPNERMYAQPLSGVVVTIITGPRSGERVITNQNGQYTFPDVEGNELHLRVEKERFETKKVIVHRSRPTTLSSGIAIKYKKDPQKNPGIILMGQRWPEGVRFILEQELVVHDLLYIEAALGPHIGGWYSNMGVVVISYDTHHHPLLFAHEIAHARQHAIVSIDGSGRIERWVDTPEGMSFAEARKKDWEAYGKCSIDKPHWLESLIENAAELCAEYWSIGAWKETVFHKDIQEKAPNRLKWAKEWLNIKR